MKKTTLLREIRESSADELRVLVAERDPRVPAAPNAAARKRLIAARDYQEVISYSFVPSALDRRLRSRHSRRYALVDRERRPRP